MIEPNDAEWGLCDHHLLPGDYRDDEEDYEAEEDVGDQRDGYDEWDGYDDDAAAESMARLAAEIEPGRATAAQWAQAIRRLGSRRRSQPGR